MTFDEAVHAFKRKHPELSLTRVADGKCGAYSYRFIRFLQENFVPRRHLAKEVTYLASTARHHPLRPAILTRKQNERFDRSASCRPKRPPGAWASHTVVRVGRVRIDWTARQFDKRAPVPLIWCTK